MSNYQLGCIEEAKRWDRIAKNATGRTGKNREYAEKVASRWREKASEAAR